MSQIIIASKANSFHLAEAQVLAEFCRENCPSFEYKVLMKHKNEWNSFAVALKNSYGFSKLCCPLIFTVEGWLIGDINDFKEMVHWRFQKEYTEQKEILEQWAKKNIEK